MNLQHERIAALCAELHLSAVAENYPTLAQGAVEESRSFVDFLESVLMAEKTARHGRTRSTMTRLAGFPAIKTLDEFDYEFAGGVPKATIQELSSLAFIERTENVVLLGPSGVGKTHCDNRLSMARQRQRCQAAPCRIGMTPRLIDASLNVAFALDMSPIRKGAGLTTGDWPD